jgi:hypothetical protein
MHVSLLALRRQADNIEDAPRCLVRSMGEQCGRPSKPRSKPSLYCRETAFRRQRQVATKPPTGSANRSRRPTAFAQSRHVAVIHGQFGKSRFAQDCVVGLRGLEPPTKRFSGSERLIENPERSPTGRPSIWCCREHSAGKTMRRTLVHSCLGNNRLVRSSSPLSPTT